MEGTEVSTSYATEKRPVSPVWIIITLAKALLLHNQRAFYQTACLLSNGFESHKNPYFNSTSRKTSNYTNCRKKKKDKGKTSNLNSVRSKRRV